MNIKSAAFTVSEKSINRRSYRGKSQHGMYNINLIKSQMRKSQCLSDTNINIIGTAPIGQLVERPFSKVEVVG